MAKENKNGDEAITKEDMNALRSELDSKVAAANQRVADAEGRASQAESRVVGKEYDIALPEGEDSLSSEQRSELSGALQKGKEAQSNLSQIVPMLVEQQAKALALEVALEYDAGKDVETLISRIKVGRTPAKMDALAKEISLEYKEKAIDAKADSKDDEEDDADDSGSTRKFAEGGGKGSVSSNKLLDDIDKINISDPIKAQEELDALYSQLVIKT